MKDVRILVLQGLRKEMAKENAKKFKKPEEPEAPKQGTPSIAIRLAKLKEK